MTRAERLLALLDALGRHRRPVSGRVLADETGVSLRTLYRDIASLQAQGAMIEGEAGVGYVMRPGYLLPPLMFTSDEIEALMLGSHWVAHHADTPLRDAARSALARIAAVLPPEKRAALDGTIVLSGPGPKIAPDGIDLGVLRQAIRSERKLKIGYCDLSGQQTSREIWPIVLSFFDHVRVVVAWCELRGGFRHFRTDRITAAELGARYAKRRAALLQAWRAEQGIPDPKNGC